MFTKLALTSIFLFSLFALAQDTPDATDSVTAVNNAYTAQVTQTTGQYEASLKSMGPAYANLSQTYQTLKKGYDDLLGSVIKAQNQLNIDTKKQKDDTKGWQALGIESAGYQGPPKADQVAIDKDTQQLNTLNSQLAPARMQLTEAQAHAYGAQKDTDQTTAAKAAALKDLKSNQDAALQTIKTQVSNLQKQLNWEKLETNYSELDVKALKASDVLHQIENAYDKKIIGSYVAAKIEKLMTSNAMCKIKDLCDKDQKNKYQINRADMSQIFSGSPGYLPDAAPRSNASGADSSNQNK